MVLSTPQRSTQMNARPARGASTPANLERSQNHVINALQEEMVGTTAKVEMATVEMGGHGVILMLGSTRMQILLGDSKKEVQKGSGAKATATGSRDQQWC